MDIQEIRQYHQAREARRRAAAEEQRLQCLAQVRTSVLQYAPAFPAIQSVYLFGSLLHIGRFRRDSDIDLALVCDRIEVESAFCRVLEREVRRTIDLRPLSDAILDVVAHSGEKVYERTIVNPGEEHSA